MAIFRGVGQDPPWEAIFEPKPSFLAIPEAHRGVLAGQGQPKGPHVGLPGPPKTPKYTN